MLNIFPKGISKNEYKDYNDVEQIVNIHEICEPSNPYGHVREFTKLNKQAKYDAHRVISRVASVLSVKGKNYGVATDISGNTYYFDVFEDGYYRVAKIAKYKDLTREVTNEKYIKTNS